MKRLSLAIRGLVTVSVFVGLGIFLSRSDFSFPASALRNPWTVLAVCLFPLFLAMRIWKWTLLLRQLVSPLNHRRLVASYLEGMAVGLITPGRVGELARVKGLNAPLTSIGVFLLEKMLEISVLFSLVFLALLGAGFLPWWTALVFFAGLLLVARFWKPLLTWAGIRLLHLVQRKADRDTAGQRESSFVWSVHHLKTKGCIFFSAGCFCLFSLQVYLAMTGLSQKPLPWAVLFLLPLVFLANFFPVTIGGFGLREALAALVLQHQNVPEIVAVLGFALVSFFNLVVPAIAGALVYLADLRYVES